MSKKNPSIQTIALNFIENKNNTTFTTLINRLKPGLLSFANNIVKDKDLANEVLSRTFIAIWEKIHQYNYSYNFSTWAYAIAKNEALGILRDGQKNISYDAYANNHNRLLQTYNPVVTMNTECIGPIGEELTQQLYDASLSAINE